MKLASLRTGGRDGTLVVVSRDLRRYHTVPTIAPTLQAALDDWARCEPLLRAVSRTLDEGPGDGAPAFMTEDCAAPLPRAYQWADGSAYLNHVELVRKARGAALPESFHSEPLIYQGGSDTLIGATDEILADPAWGIDFEAEVAVITGDVAMGSGPEQALEAIRLVMLVNDVSLRELIPAELAKGFGFFQSKPSSAFSPVAVSRDELGTAWHDGMLHLPLRVDFNGKPFGRPDAGVGMGFSFARLIAHMAKTRALGAGTIVGSGTVSNRHASLENSSIADGGVGFGCIAELRSVETLTRGAPATPFMGDGDVVRIEVLDARGDSLFGAIENRVRAVTDPLAVGSPASSPRAGARR